jgi:histidyl-tRNA synthetase
MADKSEKTKARLPRGFVDRSAEDIRAVEKMMARIREVYELYGFEPADQPLIEYTDALGKFLPDQDRPNEGVFSFQDDDDQWLSLRYDLTAPTARYVAENYERLPKPYRSYRSGWVFRNEKPGPGRFRQFMQFDADTIGTPGVAADAEMAMMMADVMEALGIKRGDYVIRVNNRKVLDGVLEAIGLGGDENAGRRLTVLRAIDKADKFPIEDIGKLLGPGRWDGDSEGEGDFTKGAGLKDAEIELILSLVRSELKKDVQLRTGLKTVADAAEQGDEALRSLIPVQDRVENGRYARELGNWIGMFARPEPTSTPSNSSTLQDDTIVFDGRFEHLSVGQIRNATTIDRLRARRVESSTYDAGVDELETISSIVSSAGYGTNRIRIDPSVVRGLEYYTGPVYEAELLAEIPNDEGKIVRFGSVGGGGRYDGLVSRFRGEPVPATGFSIGVSRLTAALKALGKVDTSDVIAPVVVLVMDKDTESLGRYQKMVSELRQAGIRAEMYLGGAGMKAQIKYADRRGSPAVVIQGGDERAQGVVQIKDMVEGARQAAAIAGHAEYKEARPGQVTVPEADLVAEVRKILDAQAAERERG